MRYYKEDYEVREKGVGNPVTDADVEADGMLRETLLGECPEDGWLSEETKDNADRLSCRRVWIVDPIDGTKEFIKGVPQFAVSIALAVEGEIALGVIFNPARQEMYTAVRGQGVMLNGKKVGVTACDSLAEANILASRSEVARGEFDRFKDYHITPIGSIAYKLALIGAGLADLTFTLTPKNEWDFAAGSLLVTEGGGRVQVLGDHPQTFNGPDPLVEGVVATNRALFGQVMELIGKA